MRKKKEKDYRLHKEQFYLKSNFTTANAKLSHWNKAKINGQNKKL